MFNLSAKQLALYTQCAKQSGQSLEQWLASSLDAVASSTRLTPPDWMNGMSKRLQNCLLSELIFTQDELLEQWAKRSASEWIAVNNFGKSMYTELSRCLKTETA